MNSRIDELKRQLRQVDGLATSGALSPQQAAESRARLEKELVAAVVDDAPVPTAANPAAKPSRGLVAALASIVIVVAVAGYAWMGKPEALRGTPVAAAPEASAGHTAQTAQIEAMVAKLGERLKEKPDDAEGWSMLGRSYSVLGRYGDAVAAFKRVTGLRPSDAQALADLADATAMAAGRQLAGEPEKLIMRALALDPKNLKALALAGTIAFDRGDFPAAVRHWENAVAVAEPGSELARNLQGGAAEARSRAGMAAAAAAAPAAPAAATSGATLSGRVQLAAALKDKVAPGDTLFVFARAVDGPRAPLAILRKQVKDLPLTFTLDESMAMNPALSLASAKQVIVGARISKSGNAIAQPGDLQGFSPAVAVGAKGVAIEIGEAVK